MLPPRNGIVRIRRMQEWKGAMYSELVMDLSWGRVEPFAVNLSESASPPSQERIMHPPTHGPLFRTEAAFDDLTVILTGVRNTWDHRWMWLWCPANKRGNPRCIRAPEKAAFFVTILNPLYREEAIVMAAEKKSTLLNWVMIIERAPSRAQEANGEDPSVLALRIRVQAIGQIGVKVTVAVEKV